MRRNIINIDQEKCTGCEMCIPNCPEGAIQVIDGKARLVSDLMCDGLGACLGHCPEGAITVEEREAEPYDERKVMANIVKQGPNTIRAHMVHLKEHGQEQFLKEAVDYLNEKGIAVPELVEESMKEEKFTGCPGSKTMAFKRENTAEEVQVTNLTSELTHWPVQMHLISPSSPHYRGSDMVLAADCVAFSAGNFHREYLKGKTLGIACPKLDEGQEIYLEKIKGLIDIAKINTLTVITMQVPCCGGLLRLAMQASVEASRKIPVKSIVIGIQGEKLHEEWL